MFSMGSGRKIWKQLQFRGSAGTCTNNNVNIMAEIFNNRICVFANELILFNPKTKVGSEDGFINENTYYKMARNGQLIVLRRGIPGCPALEIGRAHV